MSSDTGGTKTGGMGNPGAGRMSWAERLGTSLPAGLEKNILEIVLEKDDKGPFVVSESDCARVMRKIGIDQRPGVHVDSIQICPNGRGVILITMNKDIKLENFCSYGSFEVTSSGIRSSLIKPAGKREVVLTMKGIHPNTRDSVVMEYLSRFGKLSSSKVVYGMYNDGPLKGFKNGDRSYKMELKPGDNIGSFHVIETQKVTVRYNGQLQTCGRCHRTPKQCRGGGIAKRCQAEGGIKVDFMDYILNLWREIGYSPKQAELSQDMNTDEEVEPVEVETVEEFTPVKIPAVQSEYFSGVRISRFPKGLDDGDIIAMICRCGLEENKKDNIVIKAGGNVTVKNISTEESNALIDAIHGKRFFERKMFCNGIVPLTPDKQVPPSPAANSPVAAAVIRTEVPASPTAPSPSSPRATTANTSVAAAETCTAAPPSSPTSTSSSSPRNDTESSVTYAVSEGGKAASLSATLRNTSAAAPRSPASGITPGRPSVSRSVTAADNPLASWRSADPNLFSDFEANYNLARRHSISLINRTPPHQSLAAEIMGTCNSTSRERSRLLVNEITECLSDFNSCISDFSSDKSSDENDDKVKEVEKNNSVNDKKKAKRNKRKNSLTPNKDFFLKKQNTEPATSC